MLRRSVGGRSTRSICLVLACLSLALHILLAIFCLSVLQTACVPPHSSSSSPLHDPGSTSRQTKSSVIISNGIFANNATEWEKEPTGDKISTKGMREVDPGGSKLEALFSHPLYNLQRPEMQEDDWLLRVKNSEDEEEERDTGGEEEEDTNWTVAAETHPPWLRFHLGISRWELYHRTDPLLDQVTHYISTQRILNVVQKRGGTQLKLLMSFPNHGEALLKPMRQTRDAETDVNLFYFSDFERHNAEISAFHLDRILGFQRIPPVVGRLVDVVSEIKDVTTDKKLLRTFFTSPVGNTCFYGQCEYYCSTENPVCGGPLALEVSLATMLPDLTLAPRRSWRSPWRRSYSRTKLAQWEKDPAFCDGVKQTPPYDEGTRLVDLMDMAVLDFLMGNMDRHHYETFEKFGNKTFMLHLDNGRAFGRHSRDEPSILAPLRQCCRIRRSTLLRLRLMSRPGFRLSDVMRESLDRDPLAVIQPLLSEAHLSALDRRLAMVLQVLHTCQDLHDDRFQWDSSTHFRVGLLMIRDSNDITQRKRC
uniref:FAM20 C-terminal domain-containing protein n=1 Tax=Gadus morhua TaxID=8049 RepID=A0A8C5FWN5_GADMO